MWFKKICIFLCVFLFDQILPMDSEEARFTPRAGQAKTFQVDGVGQTNFDDEIKQKKRRKRKRRRRKKGKRKHGLSSDQHSLSKQKIEQKPWQLREERFVLKKWGCKQGRITVIDYKENVDVLYELLTGWHNGSQACSVLAKEIKCARGATQIAVLEKLLLEDKSPLDLKGKEHLIQAMLDNLISLDVLLFFERDESMREQHGWVAQKIEEARQKYVESSNRKHVAKSNNSYSDESSNNVYSDQCGIS